MGSVRTAFLIAFLAGLAVPSCALGDDAGLELPAAVKARKKAAPLRRLEVVRQRRDRGATRLLDAVEVRGDGKVTVTEWPGQSARRVVTGQATEAELAAFAEAASRARGPSAAHAVVGPTGLALTIHAEPAKGAPRSFSLEASALEGALRTISDLALELKRRVVRESGERVAAALEGVTLLSHDGKRIVEVRRDGRAAARDLTSQPAPREGTLLPGELDELLAAVSASDPSTLAPAGPPPPLEDRVSVYVTRRGDRPGGPPGGSATLSRSSLDEGDALARLVHLLDRVGERLLGTKDTPPAPPGKATAGLLGELGSARR